MEPGPKRGSISSGDGSTLEWPTREDKRNEATPARTKSPARTVSAIHWRPAGEIEIAQNLGLHEGGKRTGVEVECNGRELAVRCGSDFDGVGRVSGQNWKVGVFT